jgi:hypothetical protein
VSGDFLPFLTLQDGQNPAAAGKRDLQDKRCDLRARRSLRPRGNRRPRPNAICCSLAGEPEMLPITKDAYLDTQSKVSFLIRPLSFRDMPTIFDTPTGLCDISVESSDVSTEFHEISDRFCQNSGHTNFL